MVVQGPMSIKIVNVRVDHALNIIIANSCLFMAKNRDKEQIDTNKLTTLSKYYYSAMRGHSKANLKP